MDSFKLQSNNCCCFLFLKNDVYKQMKTSWSMIVTIWFWPLSKLHCDFNNWFPFPLNNHLFRFYNQQYKIHHFISDSENWLVFVFIMYQWTRLDKCASSWNKSFEWLNKHEKTFKKITVFRFSIISHHHNSTHTN